MNVAWGVGALGKIAGFVALLLFLISNSASAARRFEGIENNPRSRESLLGEYVEMAEERCAGGFTASGRKGDECLVVLRERRKECDRMLLQVMPETVASRPIAIDWAKRYGLCINL